MAILVGRSNRSGKTWGVWVIKLSVGGLGVRLVKVGLMKVYGVMLNDNRLGCLGYGDRLVMLGLGWWAYGG